MHGDGIKPAAVAIVSGHDRADHAVVLGSNEKEIGLHGSLGGDRRFRCIPRWVVGEGLQPQGFYALKKLICIGDDLHQPPPTRLEWIESPADATRSMPKHH